MRVPVEDGNTSAQYDSTRRRTSAIRTAVPYIVGLVVSWLITLGLPASVKDAATGTLTFLLGTAYYLAVRALEKKWPKLGWLLGSPSGPTYPAL